jgi:uncharacterized protein (DUF2164 family)
MAHQNYALVEILSRDMQPQFFNEGMEDVGFTPRLYIIYV